jgi:nitrate reductase NapD
MPISGILAVCRPADLRCVRRSIDRQAWAEVHYTSPDGRLVVTIEGDTTDIVMDRMLELQKLPGVLTAAMAEHWLEDEARGRPRPSGSRTDANPLRTGVIR